MMTKWFTTNLERGRRYIVPVSYPPIVVTSRAESRQQTFRNDTSVIGPATAVRPARVKYYRYVPVTFDLAAVAPPAVLLRQPVWCDRASSGNRSARRMPAILKKLP
jgi:hypothetical protein